MTSVKNLHILCYVNHYFGPAPYKALASTGPAPCGAPYRSYSQEPSIRRKYVQRTLAALRHLSRLREVGEVDVQVCGIRPHALVPVDIDFSHLSDPRFLIYESLARMVPLLNEYDYFVNIEDDMLLPQRTFKNILEFDQCNPPQECLHPNRIEQAWWRRKFLDPADAPAHWLNIEKNYRGHRLRVKTNPHSGILILSRKKFRYCLNRIDPSSREIVLGDPMASAFAYFHSPFTLYRPFEDARFHILIHQDRHHPDWEKR